MRKMTKYFQENILKKRSYLKMEWIERVIANPEKTEIHHEENRVRMWGFIQEENKYLRVVLLESGEIHNSFFDRDFKKKG